MDELWVRRKESALARIGGSTMQKSQQVPEEEKDLISRKWFAVIARRHLFCVPDYRLQAYNFSSQKGDLMGFASKPV